MAPGGRLSAVPLHESENAKARAQEASGPGHKAVTASASAAFQPSRTWLEESPPPPVAITSASPASPAGLQKVLKCCPPHLSMASVPAVLLCGPLLSSEQGSARPLGWYSPGGHMGTPPTAASKPGSQGGWWLASKKPHGDPGGPGPQRPGLGC